MKADSCRFCRLYAIFVGSFGALLGVVSAAQMAFTLRQLGGAELALPALAMNALRSLAPAVTGSALLTAFVVWAHPLPLPRVQAELPRFLKRAVLVSAPGYLVAVLVILVAALLTAAAVLGLPWSSLRSAFKAVTPFDWGVGFLGSLVDSGLIAFLAWRYLARLQAGKSSLPMKLVLAWTFGTGLRMTAGLLLSLLLPA